jgi:hypothetical protein
LLKIAHNLVNGEQFKNLSIRKAKKFKFEIKIAKVEFLLDFIEKKGFEMFRIVDKKN